MKKTLAGVFMALSLRATPAITDRLDQIVAKYASAETAPGCVVGIVKSREVVYRRAFGMADLEHSVRNTDTSAFYIASVSKPFTALATLILVNDGKLQLDDPVRRYIPELPAYAEGITVRDLLQHTGGLRDYLELLRLSGFRNDRRIRENDVREILARQRALNFDPGTEHLYSNSGYVLLSMLVSKVGGVPFRQFAKQRIFRVLGMADTAYYDDSTALVPNRAFGYSRAGSAWRLNSFQLDVVGDGGIFTTLDDMLRWARLLEESVLGGRTPLQLLSAPGRLRSGQRISYGMGLEAAALGRYSALQHGGVFGGYNAHLLYLPGEGIASVTMCNSDSTDAGELNKSLAAAMLPVDVSQNASTAPAHAPVPDAIVRRTAGFYRGDRGEYIQLERRDDEFLLKTRKGRYPLFLADTDTLQATTDAAVRLRLCTATGEPLMLRSPNREERVTRIRPEERTATDLSVFVGRYWSDEAGTAIVVESRSGRLYWRSSSGAESAMYPVVPGEFASGAGRIRCLSNERGGVTGLLLDGVRIRGVFFRRTQ